MRIEALVHRSAAPSRVRTKQPARAVTGQLLDAVGVACEQRRQCRGRLQRQDPRVRVEGHGVALVEHPAHDGRGLLGHVRVDQEERCARIVLAQDIEQPRRGRRIGTIVVGKIDERPVR